MTYYAQGFERLSLPIAAVRVFKVAMLRQSYVVEGEVR